MPLLTPYPKLRYDFAEWLNKTDAFPRHIQKDFTRSFYLSIQPEPLQHFYLSLYAESVGYKIMEAAGNLLQWYVYPVYDKGMVIQGFPTFPAAFDHFAQIREKELNNK